MDSRSKPTGPTRRPRRLRRSEAIRGLVRETELAPRRLVLPQFVIEGESRTEPIAAMPGRARLSVDRTIDECREAISLGVRSFALFPLVDASLKTNDGTEAVNPDNLLCRAVRRIKEAGPSACVITDVALDPYSSVGHDGIVSDNGVVQNDETVEILARMAVVHAEAGADIVAPSDMMDGRVAAIRRALDGNGLQDTPILSYAAKYASAFYGPFREAAQSAPSFGDRRSHQMDPANAREALREVALDIEEGADIVMVKPALPYLDIIHRVRDTYPLPLAAYQVSGEYAMVMAAARNNWIDRDRVMMESLIAIRRAGADLIVTYFAKDAARLLRR